MTLDLMELAVGTSGVTQPDQDAEVGMSEVVLLETETVVEE